MDNAEKEQLYVKLRTKEGKIIPRWNTIQESGKSIIRENLSLMSVNSCCYCGKRILESNLDVDHYLPSSKFPFISYCWDNLLPSCKRCNQALKRSYYPPILKDKKIIENCGQKIVDPFDITYNKNIIYSLSRNERIIDPTFDNVDDHLEFKPELFLYKPKSKIGEKTIEIFFSNAETMKYFEQISNTVKHLVGDIDRVNGRIALDNFIGIDGSEYYYNVYWEYWISEKMAGRL